MFVSVRRYREVPSLTALCSDIELEFVPRLEKSPGFIAYYAVDGGDGSLTTISVFSTAAMAEESNSEAAAWMRERNPEASLVPVEVVSGRLAVAVPPIHG
ncbi:MAG: hypothetical protein QNJ67_14800 [Kiloniellales bacterium]|nr:hypothetical protein [Kiloniellales bacterium]